ncbi:MAG: alpha/beta fold hydrolase [Pyrinomonadaceae bacterium]
MKITRQILTLAILLLAFYVPGVVAQESLEGDWAGGSNLSPTTHGFIQARFERTGTSFSDLFNAQTWNAAKRSMSNIRVESARLHFEFPSAAGTPFVADGELKDNVIRGTIRRGEEQGKFHLVRVARVNTRAYNDYVGAHQVAPNSTNLVTWSAFRHLRVVNINEGAGDSLLPLSENRFFLGRSVVDSTTPAEIVTFVRNAQGQVTGFTLHKDGNLVVSAPKAEPYRQEQVSFRNGNVRLAGTLLTPRTKFRHSAVVLVHGSQDRGRDDKFPFIVADGYLRLGIAVLIFDKRGVGGSTGDWHTSSFEDLAGDVSAGVRFLKSRRDINRRQIGLEGSSQGGWVAPVVAARDRSVAFMILAAAAGVSPAEQVTYDQLGKARAAGVPESELQEAEAFLRLQFEASRSPEAWQRFQATIPNVKNKRWFQFTLGGIPRESWLWESTRLTSFFEPVPVLRRVGCPVLLLFGGADTNYPAQRSAEIMGRALREGGNHDVTAKIFPGANHSFLVRQSDGRWIPAPDPDNTKHNWLIRRVNVDF